MDRSAEIERLRPGLQYLVDRGLYASVEDAAENGFLLFEDGEAGKAELRAKLDVAIAQFDAGQGIPAEQVRAELLAELYAEHPDIFGEDAAA